MQAEADPVDEFFQEQQVVAFKRLVDMEHKHAHLLFMLASWRVGNFRGIPPS